MLTISASNNLSYKQESQLMYINWLSCLFELMLVVIGH